MSAQSIYGLLVNADASAQFCCRQIWQRLAYQNLYRLNLRRAQFNLAKCMILQTIYELTRLDFCSHIFLVRWTQTSGH